MKKIRLAILGLNHGYKFATDALTLPDVELVAVAGNNMLARERAKQLNLPLFEDYRDLVDTCEVDGVIITLPNRLHKDAAIYCAKRGRHVLVEKPIADTIEDGYDIIHQCRENGVKLLVGHHRRYSDKVLKLRSLIRSGRIGRLVGANLLWVLAKDRPYFNEKWRVVREGGGPLLINSIHDIDNFRFVTGLTVQSVYASAGNFIRNHPVEDTVSVVLKTAEGPTATYFVSDGTPSPWSYEFTLNENPKYHYQDENTYFFFGTDGSISFPKLEIYYHDPDHFGWNDKLFREQLAVGDNDPMTAELVHFVDMLRSDTPPMVSGEDGLETLKVLNAIRKSAETGLEVAVETP